MLQCCESSTLPNEPDLELERLTTAEFPRWIGRASGELTQSRSRGLTSVDALESIFGMVPKSLEVVPIADRIVRLNPSRGTAANHLEDELMLQLHPTPNQSNEFQ
jgi:hypothetical protein